MDTLVLKLKGKATSNCSKKENELLIPVTYESSVDGNEYGVVVLNITANISDTKQYVYDNVLKVTDKLGNYQFGIGTWEKSNNTFSEFDPVNGIYSDEITHETLFLYGSTVKTVKIFFKKKEDSKNKSGLIDILPLIDSFTYNMLGQEGAGNFVSANSKAKGKTPLTLSAIPLLTDSIHDLKIESLNCSLSEIPDIFPDAISVSIDKLSSYYIDGLADSKIEKLHSNRFDGDLINLPKGLKIMYDTYFDKGYLHYSGDKSAKFTQLNQIFLYQSALSLTQEEMDNFLGCLAASTWSGDNKQLSINPGKGVSLNQESIDAIKGKGVVIA